MEIQKLKGYPPVNCQPLLGNVSKKDAQPIITVKNSNKKVGKINYFA